MLNVRLVPVALAMSLFAAPAFSQEKAKCASHHAEHELIENNPGLAATIAANEAQLKEDIAEYLTKQKRDNPEYIIPVVFHVLYDFGPELLADEQIHDAMRILNEDFNAENTDLDDVVPSFQNIIGDAKIEFRLAQIDPDGNPTNGIDKISTQETYVGDDGSKLNPWPRDKYLNIWTAREIAVSNAAAYAYRPAAVSTSGQASIDGIISDYTYIGSFGSGSQGSSSRTLTHEIGHYLNLAHPWGPTNDPLIATNCDVDDEVLDTPNTIGNQTCNLNGTSCGSLDNVQNFMDYASCEVMFTEGQVQRMHATLNSSVADRENLWQQSNLEATGVVGTQVADFTVTSPVVCMGEMMQFTDRSFYDQNSWDWNMEGAAPASSSAQNPSVFFTGPGLMDINLTVSDGDNTASVSREDAILVAPWVGTHLPVTESFDNSSLPSNGWIGHNFDRDEYSWTYAPGAGYDGSDAVKMNNNGNLSATVDYLYSSTYDLSNLEDAVISFRVAYVQRDNNIDRLFLRGSADCGETWTTLWVRSGSTLATASSTFQDFTPANNNEWTQFIVDNVPTSLYSETFMLRFEFENDGGNNLYIDDINLDGTFSDTPVLEMPENGAQHQDANTLLNWKAVPDADFYEFEYDTEITMNSAQLVTGTNNYIDISPLNEDTEHEALDLTPNQTYFWRVRASTNGTTSPWSEIWSFTVASNGVGVDERMAEQIGFRVVPNPVESTGRIEFELYEQQDADLRIYDLMGREVLLLQQGTLGAGRQTYSLETGTLGSGLYLAKLILGTHELTQKFVIK